MNRNPVTITLAKLVGMKDQEVSKKPQEYEHPIADMFMDLDIPDLSKFAVKRPEERS
jgi:hypothetical protein